MRAESEKGGRERQPTTVKAMEDCKIVDLYWARDEKAISESDKKYGRVLASLSYSLLHSHEDAEECVNDTYLDAWGAMPDARPVYLGAFLQKITRRISIDRYRKIHSEKRGGIDNICEELSDVIPDRDNSDFNLENGRLKEALDSFLYSLEREKRVMFVLRYFHSRSISEISRQMALGESKVKTTLFRVRQELQKYLEGQGLL